MSSKRLTYAEAPGKIVRINDTEMHVYSIQSTSASKKGTIIFLSGSGTECPTYDFKPLWILLQGKCNMAIVERPGYGWSGTTKYPRDIDTILEETREALRQAGISAPFIPAAHSVAGLEAIYWVQKYPEEIPAIIGLDMSVPPVYRDMELPKALDLMSKIGHLLRNPIAKLMVKQHPAVKSSLLNKEEQAAMEFIISKQLLSKNMMDEVGYVVQNANQIEGNNSLMIPLLCFLSNNRAILKRIPFWGKIHREYFASNNQAQFFDLNCGHYVHREVPQKIADVVNQFMK